MVVYTCNCSSSRGTGRSVFSSRPAQAKLERPYLINKIKSKTKRKLRRVGGIA
jgi:hypothetical protein